MGKSSIHLQTAKGGTVLHNARENYSKSVVFTDEKNEIWNDSKTAFKMFRDELEIRTKAYTERTGQKLHKSTSTMISGVVNLEQHHNLKDMEKIKDYLELEFGTKVIQMAIHRDEGKLINKENQDLKLVSGKDFFLNSKDNELYFDNKFTKKIDMNEWNIEKNYHGHFEMLGLDNEGKTLRKKMNIIKLSKLQDFTAQSLGMERTLSNVIVNEKGKAQRKSTTNKKRLDTHEFKEQAKIINETKKDLVSEKEIKKEILELKKQLQEEKAKRPDYAKLEDMNKTLLERVHEKNLTINDFKIEIDTYKKEREQLKKQIDTLTVENKDLKSLTSNLAAESVSNFEEAEKQKQKVKALETQNKALQEQINTKPVQSIENEIKALVSSEINLNDIKKNSLDLFTSDFKEEINLKENGVFNKSYKIELKQEFKTQEITLENIGLFKRTQMKITSLLETIKNQALRIAGLKKENQLLNSELKSERLKNQVLEIKVLNLENKNKTLSITGEKKETALDKIVSNFDKMEQMKARELDTKEILQGSKKEKDQEEVKETTKPKQHRGYELG
jgi:hypothetical protein